jgi:PhzF family phenazine biosynthesis protein
MVERRFQQVDVFAEQPMLGNPVAVVVDGVGLTTEQMQRFANWTNLSETTFVSPAARAEADYAVRIFTPDVELPFAGHPTLGSCHAWLRSGGEPAEPGVVVQECATGLVRIRRDGEQLAFAAPPLVRGGDVDEADLERVVRVLGVDRGDVVRSQWVDNGPGWIGVQLRDADAVLALRPGPLDDLNVGVIGASAPGAAEAFEVRAFFSKAGQTTEDPVTGSLNASLGEWLLRTGIATAPYRVRQGTALGRHGVVTIDQTEPGGDVWVGGATVTCIEGTVWL